MMLSIMKSISGIGAFITLAIGLIMTGITIYGYTNSQIFLDDTSSRNSIMGVLIITDILVIVASIMGIFGIKRNNILLIFIFQIFVLIFMIVFFSLGIAAQVLPGQFFEGNCTSSSNPTINLAYQINILSDITLCGKLCACSLTNNTIDTKYSPIQSQIIYALKLNRTDQGSKSFQYCDVTKMISDDKKRMAIALGVVEDTLKCSGWCRLESNNPFGWIYRFSDVNNGKPEGFCYDTLKDTVNTYANVIGLGAFFTSIFFLLILLVNMYIGFSPERKNLSLKERFSYIPQGKYRRLV